MELDRPVVALCMAGVQAEFERRIDEARRLYAVAWESSVDDYDKCVAAHYVAHLEADSETALHWNQVALDHAQRADSGQVAEFMPSLYVNLGHSYEKLGDAVMSARYYALAADLGLVHQPE